MQSFSVNKLVCAGHRPAFACSRPPFVVNAHRRHIHVRRAANGEPPAFKDPEDACSSIFPMGPDFLRELAQDPRVRVVFEEPNEDQDDWDDVMEELDDPWMRSPAPLDPDDNPLLATGTADAGALRPVSVDALASAAAASSSPAAEAIAAAAAASGPSAEVPALSYEQLQRLLSSTSAAAAAAAAAPAGDCGHAHATSCCRRQPAAAAVPPVLLDVRTAEEFGAGHIPGSRNVPIDELTGEVARSIAASAAAAASSLQQPQQQHGSGCGGAAAAGTPEPCSTAAGDVPAAAGISLVVIGSGDHRALQACLRLKRVYGAPGVALLQGPPPQQA